MIQNISAVTFAVSDMARSIEFYSKLGFDLLYGGERAAFSSLRVGEALVNLSASPGYETRMVGPSDFPSGSRGRAPPGPSGTRPPRRVAERCAMGRALLPRYRSRRARAQLRRVVARQLVIRGLRS